MGKSRLQQTPEYFQGNKSGRLKETNVTMDLSKIPKHHTIFTTIRQRSNGRIRAGLGLVVSNQTLAVVV